MSIIKQDFGEIQNGEDVDALVTNRLCYVVYVGRDKVEIPTIKTIDKSDNFDSYLYYNESTLKFEVLKTFDAIIVPWVYQYATAPNTAGQGAFYYNDTKLKSYTTPSKSAGSKAGAVIYQHLEEGDVFYSYTPSTNGYPQQYLKVYNVVNLSEIPTVTQYVDELA